MIIRFNRHELFTSEMMEYHATTLMAYELGLPQSIIDRIDYTELYINK
jgi:hypothetical protein